MPRRKNALGVFVKRFYRRLKALGGTGALVRVTGQSLKRFFPRLSLFHDFNAAMCVGLCFSFVTALHGDVIRAENHFPNIPIIHKADRQSILSLLLIARPVIYFGVNKKSRFAAINSVDLLLGENNLGAKMPINPFGRRKPESVTRIFRVIRKQLRYAGIYAQRSPARDLAYRLDGAGVFDPVMKHSHLSWSEWIKLSVPDKNEWTLFRINRHRLLLPNRILPIETAADDDQNGPHSKSDDRDRFVLKTVSSSERQNQPAEPANNIRPDIQSHVYPFVIIARFDDFTLQAVRARLLGAGADRCIAWLGFALNSGHLQFQMVSRRPAEHLREARATSLGR